MASLYGRDCFQPGLDNDEKRRVDAVGTQERSLRVITRSNIHTVWRQQRKSDSSRRGDRRPLGGDARPRPGRRRGRNRTEGGEAVGRCRCQLFGVSRRLSSDPQRWAGERQRHFHRAGHLVHARGQIPPRERVERGLHGHGQDVRLRGRVLHVERPAYHYVFSTWPAHSTRPVQRRATSSSPRCSSRAPRPGPRSTT